MRSPGLVSVGPIPKGDFLFSIAKTVRSEWLCPHVDALLRIRLIIIWINYAQRDFTDSSKSMNLCGRSFFKSSLAVLFLSKNACRMSLGARWALISSTKENSSTETVRVKRNQNYSSTACFLSLEKAIAHAEAKSHYLMEFFSYCRHGEISFIDTYGFAAILQRK
jgi:hypothetical protein